VPADSFVGAPVTWKGFRRFSLPARSAFGPDQGIFFGSEYGKDRGSHLGQLAEIANAKRFELFRNKNTETGLFCCFTGEEASSVAIRILMAMIIVTIGPIQLQIEIQKESRSYIAE